MRSSSAAIAWIACTMPPFMSKTPGPVTRSTVDGERPSRRACRAGAPCRDGRRAGPAARRRRASARAGPMRSAPASAASAEALARSGRERRPPSDRGGEVERRRLDFDESSQVIEEVSPPPPFWRGRLVGPGLRSSRCREETTGGGRSRASWRSPSLPARAMTTAPRPPRRRRRRRRPPRSRATSTATADRPPAHRPTATAADGPLTTRPGVNQIAVLDAPVRRRGRDRQRHRRRRRQGNGRRPGLATWPASSCPASTGPTPSARRCWRARRSRCSRPTRCRRRRCTPTR